MDIQIPSGLRIYSIRGLNPNVFKPLGLSAGLISVGFAFGEKWELAIGAILLAAVFDFLDGLATLRMKGASQLAAERNSYLVCFGLAPAVLLYYWTAQGADWLGWSVAVLFCCCSALRLARLN